MNKFLSQLTIKVKAHGYRRSIADALCMIANLINNNGNIYSSGGGVHQHIAYKVLSKYISFKNKNILEIGGSSSCQSAKPFLADGAANVVVTGLGHVSKEQEYEEGVLQVVHADALALSKIFEPSSFDVVYGLSVIEHIPHPKLLLQELHRVLRPNGIAFLEGNPIWSSAKGHHLWIGTYSNSPFKGKTTADYFFYPSTTRRSTNPLPDWSHLLFEQKEMIKYLELKNIPKVDIKCIVEWVYCMNEINRMNIKEISESYTTSSFAVLEADAVRVNVPHEIKRKLIDRHGYGIDFGCEGIAYVLKKSHEK